ncbi:MAG: serine/threonine protein kinase [Planctomycetales bacterium]|nr:serine/threonine protein kinase [Planctomycetales bacterium]
MAKTGDQVGPFELADLLGAGGMGVVYRAKYAKTGQMVALKLLSETVADDDVLTARFDRELVVLKKLKHKHIVHCYGGGKHEGRRFIAMEIVVGGSLSGLLKKKGHFSWEETIRYAKQVCEALAHAHEAGIIHRDLKPANLLLTKSGDLKLTDFGLAHDLDESRLTATGKTMGTFFYMAPEQIRGFPPVSHKVDLYALGCMLFELLTGRPPFVSEQPIQVFYKQLDEMPPKVRQFATDCPIWLEILIGQLLEKNPDKRPHDALAVLQALTEVEEKVARGDTVAAHALAGTPTMLQVTQDTVAVKGLFGNKKKKKRKNVPFFEQTWFLLGCLVALAGLVTWAVWPISEQKLFDRGAALMAEAAQAERREDRDYKWVEARDRYLQPYLQRFPQGQFANQAQGYLDEIEMAKTEKVIENNARFGRENLPEPERLYVGARRYEIFGDLVTALEKYESMVQLLKDDAKSRPYVNLARRQMAKIREGGNLSDRRQLVDSALSRADDLYHKKGEVLEARKLWESIVKLYSGNRELAPQVKRANAMLVNPDAKPAAEEPESTSQ